MAQILLIEPDRILAETYYRALTGAGHNVAVCSSAQAAIMAADDTRPDIVILEFQLVSHSGMEFLYEFRSYADWQTIPVVIQTNVPPSEFAGARDLLMNELGVSAYLYKPQATLRKLCTLVDECAVFNDVV